MIKLTLQKEPFWLDLGAGAKVKVKPLSMAIYQAARTRSWADADKELGVLRDANGLVPEDVDKMLLTGLYSGYFAQHLARYSVIEWEGVLAADGSDAPCTPENVVDLMLIPAAGSAFLQDYTRSVTSVITEGNA